MAGVNKAIIVGNLGRDPEIRYAPSGTAVANFTVATTENYPSKDGGREERTEWHRIVAFGRLAEICGEYLHKGKQVYIEGRIQTRDWEDRDGNKRYTTEIVAREMQMLGPRPGGADREFEPRDQQSRPDYGARNYGSKPQEQYRSGGDYTRGGRDQEQKDWGSGKPPKDDFGGPPGDDEIPF